ncbi:MAG: hypothetical protein CM15mP49_13570 [Actinomycetota bacterium]|nr:MAG: hypothetical protein CM15mP49_13570 [Actinomycetota bacterium]
MSFLHLYPSKETLHVAWSPVLTIIVSCYFSCAIEILGSQNDGGPSTISTVSTDGSPAAILHVLLIEILLVETCTFYGATSAN